MKKLVSIVAVICVAYLGVISYQAQRSLNELHTSIESLSKDINALQVKLQQNQ